MGTLISTMESSPVKVMRVFADFRRGMPDAGTVFVGADRHQVMVCRTPGGLMARCECPSGCPARPVAIRAFQIMAEAWGRFSGTYGGLDVVGSLGLDAGVGPDQRHRASRPYDGMARATCEADLQPMSIPEWAYDEHGLRRPLCEAEVAADVWYELDRALDRLLSGRAAESTEPSHGLNGRRVRGTSRPDVLQYYRASWAPELGLSQSAFAIDLPADLGGRNQLAEVDSSR